MKQYVQQLKCDNCKTTLGEDAPVVESNIMKGVYLTVCPHCRTSLMTAGGCLIQLPETSNDPTIAELKRELSVGMHDLIIDELKTSDMPNEVKDFFGGLLCSLQDKMNAAFKEEQKYKPVKQGNVISFTTKSDECNDIKIDTDDLKTPEKEAAKAVEKRRYDQTKYVVLVDGDVYDEYASNVSPKEIFENLIESHGIEGIVNGVFTVHELVEIKPKLKETITYDLDM